MIKRVALPLATLCALTGIVVGLIIYHRVRADYDAYRTLIQPGIKIAGIDVGWSTPQEARAAIAEQVAEPYFRDLILHYEDQVIRLAPARDLQLEVPVDQVVEEAVAASHDYDYWQGFKRWIRGDVETKNLDIPLPIAFDRTAAQRFLDGVANEYDRMPSEPMVDVQNLTFIPGRPGRRLDVEQGSELVNSCVPSPDQRDVTLPVSAVMPDQSAERIRAMLSTLGPIMDSPPTAASFFSATLPLSTTGGIAGTPLVTYTGELTWTFPYFASYTGPLTSTYGFFFDPGKPGARFDVDRAVQQVELALQSGVTTPVAFNADPVPPPRVTRELLVPPLEARLAQFSGVSSLFVQNLDTGEVVYDKNTRYVMSGMSVVKIGIMVEVYRYLKGSVDAQTHQELMSMLGSQSCNPCANRLLAMVGDGSAVTGAKRVTATMNRLGLGHFRLCGPFRVEANGGAAGPVASSAYGQISLARAVDSTGLARLWSAAQATPGYDACVHATPGEMADLVKMIYQGTKSEGKLNQSYPATFTPQTCQDMIDIMAANDLRNMLGAGLPAEVKLAHKHGFAGYDVPWGDTRAEVGIVFSPGATWLISFYIWQDSPWIDFGIVQPLYRDVSNMLYNYFNPDRPYWPLPPWTQPATPQGVSAD